MYSFPDAWFCRSVLIKYHPPYSDVLGVKVGRFEKGKMQDWVFEVSSKIFKFFPAVMQYLIEETLVLEANILRDATLQKMELHHFEAYIHASAIAWTVAFNEL